GWGSDNARIGGTSGRGARPVLRPTLRVTLSGVAGSDSTSSGAPLQEARERPCARWRPPSPRGGHRAVSRRPARAPQSLQARGRLWAALTGACIVPVAVAAHPARRLPSWDEFLIPLPFARCAAVFGEAVRGAPI